MRESSCAEQATFWPRSANFRNAPFAFFRLFFFFQFLNRTRNHCNSAQRNEVWVWCLYRDTCNLVLKRVTAMSKGSSSQREILWWNAVMIAVFYLSFHPKRKQRCQVKLKSSRRKRIWSSTQGKHALLARTIVIGCYICMSVCCMSFSISKLQNKREG